MKEIIYILTLITVSHNEGLSLTGWMSTSISNPFTLMACGFPRVGPFFLPETVELSSQKPCFRKSIPFFVTYIHLSVCHVDIKIWHCTHSLCLNCVWHGWGGRPLPCCKERIKVDGCRNHKHENDIHNTGWMAIPSCSSLPLSASLVSSSLLCGVSTALAEEGALGLAPSFEDVGQLFLFAFWVRNSWTALCWKDSWGTSAFSMSLSFAVRFTVHVGQGKSIHLIIN